VVVPEVGSGGLPAEVPCQGQSQNLRCLRHRVYQGHVTPERVLQSNFRLTQANLLRRKRLAGKSALRGWRRRAPG